MSGLREYAQGGLLPWSGTYRDWRDIDGMRVPFEVDVTWQLDSGPYTYAHWRSNPWRTTVIGQAGA